MTAPELNDELRKLIDARLDEIESVLLRVSVSYTERHHILGEVEAHVYELLARGGGSPTRERLMTALDSLDPAAAYVPEELRGKLDELPVRPITPRRTGPRTSRLAVISGCLAASVFVMWLFVHTGWWRWLGTAPLFRGLQIGNWSIVFLRDATYQDWAIVCTGTLVFATLVGLMAAIRIVLSPNRLRGLPVAFFAAQMIPIVYCNSAMTTFAFGPRSVIPTLLTILAILAVNVFAMRKCWGWFNSRRHRVAELLRGNIANFGKRLSESA